MRKGSRNVRRLGRKWEAVYRVNDSKIINIIVICGVLIVFLLLWLTTIWSGSGYFNCSFKEFFGIPCLFCGMSTSLKLFLQGNLKEAFIVSPFFIYVVLLTFVMLIVSVFCLLKGSNKYWKVVSWKIIISLTFIVICLSWLYKMIVCW